MKSEADPLTDWNGQLLDVRELFSLGPRARWENACRRLAFNARLSGDDVLCRVLGRYTFVVAASDVGLAPHLIAYGFWEIWVTRLIASRVREGMTCLDVGANVGYYSVLMADLVGQTGQVIAVEPIPTTFRLLSRNLAHNGFLRSLEGMLPLALFAAASGEATLIMPQGEPKNAAFGEVCDDEIESGRYARLSAPGLGNRRPRTCPAWTS